MSGWPGRVDRGGEGTDAMPPVQLPHERSEGEQSTQALQARDRTHWSPSPRVVASAILASLACVFAIDLLSRTDLAVSIAYVVPITLTLWLPFDRDRGRATIVTTSPALAGTMLAIVVGADTLGGPGLHAHLVGDLAALGNRLLAAGSQLVVAWAVLRHRQARALEQQVRAGLESALSTADEFVALASHELKNPLAGARGYAQLLLRRASRGQSAGLDSQSTHALKLIDELLDQLNALMDDLLHVSRLHSGRFDLRLEPVDVREVAERIAEAMSERAPDHVIAVAAPEGRVLAWADRRRVEQVLINLMGNAVKYSPQGCRVAVTITQAADGAAEWADSEESVLLCVRDEGIGIPAVDQERLFNRFVRGSNASQSSIAGTGLGLYVCRMLVEAQGGRIWLERSGEGQGSTLAFTLPLWAGERPENTNGDRAGRKGHGLASDLWSAGASWPGGRASATRPVTLEAGR